MTIFKKIHLIDKTLGVFYSQKNSQTQACDEFLVFILGQIIGLWDSYLGLNLGDLVIYSVCTFIIFTAHNVVAAR